MSARFPVRDPVSGWCLSPDTRPVAAAYPQTILAVTLVDEITGLPPEAPLRASTSNAGLQALGGGLAGLAGIPLARFSPGNPASPPGSTAVPAILDTTPISLQLSLDGLGYVPVLLTTTIGPEPGYPQSFAPAAPETVTLHRAPLSLTGQVTNNAQTPLESAAITVSGIWPTIAAMQGPASPANLIALLAPLYAARDATATVAAISLIPSVTAKTLAAPRNAGDTTLTLSDQVGLAAGSVIALDTQDPQRGEYVTITSITPASPIQPAQASAALAYPLARPHAAGAVANPMLTLATGAANALAQPAQPGDVTLFPATMTGLDASLSAVIITGGGAPSAELHPASLYTAKSDLNGHAVLPPIHRLAQLTLQISHPSQPTDLLSTVTLPFGATTLALNLAFS